MQGLDGEGGGVRVEGRGEGEGGCGALSVSCRSACSACESLHMYIRRLVGRGCRVLA